MNLDPVTFFGDAMRIQLLYEQWRERFHFVCESVQRQCEQYLALGYGVNVFNECARTFFRDASCIHLLCEQYLDV